MKTRLSLAIAGIGTLLASGAMAQATGTPSYSAPDRAFHRSEFGAVMSFPEPGGTAVEGLYRTGTGKTDWSVRLGMLEPGGVEPTSVLGGLEFRSRVIDHTTDWPLDGAVVFGAGGSFASGHSVMNIPAGLSLGRRISFEDSRITVTPYVQPTAFLHGGDNLPTQFLFGMGVGADLRLSGTFDVRAGAGLGDIRGLSLGAVWVH